MEEILIKGDYIELIKLLKFTGISGSGNEAKMVVDQGKVSVNGTVEYRRRAKLQKGSIVEVSERKFKIV